MSIFGTSAPRFVTTGAATINLDYSEVIEDKPSPDRLVNKSPLSGSITNVERGDHYTVKIKVNLFKYSNPTTKFNEIVAHYRTGVYLYKHRDGNAYKDSSGSDVLMYFDLIERGYLETGNFEDVLILTFKSTEWIDLGEMV